MKEKETDHMRVALALALGQQDANTLNIKFCSSSNRLTRNPNESEVLLGNDVFNNYAVR